MFDLFLRKRYCLPLTYFWVFSPSPHWLPSINSPGWILLKCDTEVNLHIAYFIFCKETFPLHGSLFRKLHVLHSIHLPSLGLLSKVQCLSMQLPTHMLTTAYLFLASLRESSKPEEQIQMFLSLGSSIQNSKWQAFIWRCTRLTQHLLLLTITFFGFFFFFWYH